MKEGTFAAAKDHVRDIVYYPEKRPGYVGWVSLFQYGNGDLGLSFNEIRRGANPGFIPVPVGFVESMMMPYRMIPDILPSANPDYISEYVYMKSEDWGKSWAETGRSSAYTRHYWCTGFSDGELVRASFTAYRYELGDRRGSVLVERSADGGSTWTVISEFLHGYFYYVHKIKKLKGDRLIILGTLISGFGPGTARKTRGTGISGALDDEQNGFMISKDRGVTWKGPYYILPGVTGNEYDMVELSEDEYLFFNSTIQAGKTCRQIVRRTPEGYANGPVMGVKLGSPVDDDPQGGYTPEAICLSGGMLIGSRRFGFSECYSCSADLGENWYRIDRLPGPNYQPVIEALPDGSCICAWHYGADSRFGEIDMYIGTDRFTVGHCLPKPTKLVLERVYSTNRKAYVNKFTARLTSGDSPVPGKKIEFRKKEIYRTDGKLDDSDIRGCPPYSTGVTGSDGTVVFTVPEKDNVPDIHDHYRVHAMFIPGPDDMLQECESGVIGLYNLTTAAGEPAVHPVYYNSGIVMVTPEISERYPELAELFDKIDKTGRTLTAEDFAAVIRDVSRAREIMDLLLKAGLLKPAGKGKYSWYVPVYRTAPYFKEVRVCDIKEYCI